MSDTKWPVISSLSCCQGRFSGLQVCSLKRTSPSWPLITACNLPCESILKILILKHPVLIQFCRIRFQATRRSFSKSFNLMQGDVSPYRKAYEENRVEMFCAFTWWMRKVQFFCISSLFDTPCISRFSLLKQIQLQVLNLRQHFYDNC